MELGILVKVLEMVGVLETVKDFLPKLVSGAGRRRDVEHRTSATRGGTRTGGEWLLAVLLNSSDPAELECDGVNGGMPMKGYGCAPP